MSKRKMSAGQGGAFSLTDVASQLGVGGRLTTTSWVAPEHCSFEQWQQIGKTFGRIEGAILWWVGDWWAFGDHHFRARLKAISNEEWRESGLPEYQTCANAGWVSSRFKNASRRREMLPWSFHQEVAGIAVEADADALLDRAVGEKLTQREL
jgi:hypothetical protein